MLASMSSMGVEGILVYANLLLQLTAFSLVSIVLSSCYRNNAIVRYSILYTSLLSLTLLCVVSIVFQSRSSGFLLLQLETSTRHFDYLLPLLDRLFLAEPVLASDSSSTSAIVGLSSANVPAASFFRNALFFIASLPLSQIVQMLWLSGFLISTVGLLRSLHNADGISRRSQTLKADECSLFNSIVNRSEFADSTLQCRESAEIDSPVLVGIIDPVLLVPLHFFKHFSESDIRAILRHEAAHMTRRDPLFNFLQKIILGLLWFHPFVHYMDRIIVRTREEICDNYVLAEHPATDYGKVLFRLSLSQPLPAAQRDRASSAGVGLGVISGDWNLEQRISDLLNQKRGKTMKLNIRSQLLLNVTLVGFALAISACQVAPQADTNAGVETINDYSAQAVGTLGPAVMRRISQIQELLEPTDGSERDLEAAKQQLDALAERRLERMSDFEKSTLYNFYTNYYLANEDYEGATNAFEDILQVSTLRPDIRLRSLRSLGQLHAALENWSTSIRYYEQWQSAANRGDDTVVLQGLSYAHYQLENYSDALLEWEVYMTLKRENGEELTRENCSYLNSLHYSLENWEEALEITEEMIRLFNTQTDRDNLDAIKNKIEEASLVAPAIDAG